MEMVLVCWGRTGCRSLDQTGVKCFAVKKVEIEAKQGKLKSLLDLHKDVFNKELGTLIKKPLQYSVNLEVYLWHTKIK